jgi:hypothetical protein
MPVTGTRTKKDSREEKEMSWPARNGVQLNVKMEDSKLAGKVMIEQQVGMLWMDCTSDSN